MLERFRPSLLLIGGVALTATAAWLAADSARFLGETARAEGVVVSLVVQRVRATDLYRPVVRFQPVGREAFVEFTASPGLWPSPYQEGDAVVIAYRASDPSDAKIVSGCCGSCRSPQRASAGAACSPAGTMRASGLKASRPFARGALADEPRDLHPEVSQPFRNLLSSR